MELLSLVYSNFDEYSLSELILAPSGIAWEFNQELNLL